MSANQQLRPGWRRVTFGEVVREVKKTTKDPSADGIERVVGLDHLDRESLPLRRWDELADLPDGTSFTRTFKAGQVLFGKRRAYQRKVSVPDFDGVCSSDILVFEPASPDLLPGFLPYLVQSDAFFDHALGTSAGSLSPRTKWQELAKYEFVLPPLTEQHRLADLFSTFDALVASLEDAHALAQVTLRSQMRDLLEACDRWAAVRCDQVVDVQVGKKLSPERRTGLRPRPYLRAAHLRGTHVDLTDLKEMDFTEDEEESLAIRPGDVLLVEGGNRDSVAAPTFIDWQPEPALFIQNSIVRLRPRDHAHLDSRFVYWQWRARFEAGEFERQAVGTKLYHFGPGRVAASLLSVPSAGIQRQWSERLDATFAAGQAINQHRLHSRSAGFAVMNALLGGS